MDHRLFSRACHAPVKLTDTREPVAGRSPAQGSHFELHGTRQVRCQRSASGSSAWGLDSDVGRSSESRADFGHYPIKPGLAATAGSRSGKEGLLITGQPGPEPNRPFPGGEGSESGGRGSESRSPSISTGTPEPSRPCKTRCSTAKRSRQVPAPHSLELERNPNAAEAP